MKWALIIGGIVVVGFVAYKWLTPYLMAVKKIGGVAGDVSGASRDIAGTLHSIRGIFSDVENVTSGVSSVYDDLY